MEILFLSNIVCHFIIFGLSIYWIARTGHRELTKKILGSLHNEVQYITWGLGMISLFVAVNQTSHIGNTHIMTHMGTSITIGETVFNIIFTVFYALIIHGIDRITKRLSL